MGWLITIVLCIAPQFTFDLDHNGHVFMYIGGSYLLAVFAFYLLTFIYAYIRGREESSSQNTPKMNKQIKVRSKNIEKEVGSQVISIRQIILTIVAQVEVILVLAIQVILRAVVTRARAIKSSCITLWVSRYF